MGELLEVGTEVWVDGDGVELEGRVVGSGWTSYGVGAQETVYLVLLREPVESRRTTIATMVAHPDNVRARVYVPAAVLVEVPGCGGWAA